MFAGTTGRPVLARPRRSVRHVEHLEGAPCAQCRRGCRERQPVYGHGLRVHGERNRRRGAEEDLDADAHRRDGATSFVSRRPPSACGQPRRARTRRPPLPASNGVLRPGPAHGIPLKSTSCSSAPGSRTASAWTCQNVQPVRVVLLDPALPRVVNALFGGASRSPLLRAPTCSVVTYAPPVAAPGTPQGLSRTSAAEHRREMPTPAASQSRLGLLGGGRPGKASRTDAGWGMTSRTSHITWSVSGVLLGRLLDVPLNTRLGDGVNVNDARTGPRSLTWPTRPAAARDVMSIRASRPARVVVRHACVRNRRVGRTRGRCAAIACLVAACVPLGA